MSDRMSVWETIKFWLPMALLCAVVLGFVALAFSSSLKAGLIVIGVGAGFPVAVIAGMAIIERMEKRTPQTLDFLRRAALLALCVLFVLAFLKWITDDSPRCVSNRFIQECY